MDRRRFLEFTGAAATAALTGCGGGGSYSSGGYTPTPTPAPTGPNWQSLGNTLDGSVITPGTSAYAQASVVVNMRFDTIQPQAVVRCASTSDVVKALAFARGNNLAITPRCGGHGFGGDSTGTGMVIDVSPMNTVQVNGDGTATIGAGAKLADVYDQLTSKGVAIPSGTCLSVGIAGITMGGGIGLVDRMYGLTCDNLVSAQVVLADGTIVTCDATHEPELFWGLRGGGGGNFGVVTSFTFRTHATRDLTNFYAVFSYADALKVFAAWQAWALSAPDSIWSYLITSFYNPAGQPNIVLSGVSISTEAEFQPYWTAFLASTASTPVASDVTTLSYRDTMLGFCAGYTISECHLVGQTPDGKIQRYPFASSSDFFNTAMPAAGVQALLQGIQNAQAAGITGQVICDFMGGALGRVAPGDTAYVHRNALFSAEYYMDAPVGTTATWSNGMRTVMQPWSSGGAYVNYIDPLIQNWPTAYYGSNYARLVLVKAAYDPNRLFRFPQGIPPS
jgi:FAD/FMN-containing dehydrogenase